MTKYTLEEFVEKMKIINQNIQITDDEFKGMAKKIKCKCVIDDYEWEALPSNLVKNYGCPKCAGNIKPTIEEVKAILSVKSPNILLMVDSYVNSKTKMKCKCKIDGNEWSTTWARLKNGAGCPKCANKKSGDKKRFSFEYVEKELAKLNPFIKIVSDQYLGANEDIVCKCLKHDYTWTTKWALLKKGAGCPECTHESHLLNFEDVKLRISLVHENIEIISETYSGVKSMLKCRCKIDGEIWFAPYERLILGKHKCKECTRRKRRKNIEKIVSEKHPHIEILTTKYLGAQSKVKCKCGIDGLVWETTWACLQQGHGCWECGDRNRRGENSPLWKGGTSPLREYLRTSIAPWKRDSKKACQYKCFITGDRFDDIHHIYGFEFIFQETFELEKLPIHDEINKYSDSELLRLEKRCLDLHYKYELGVCLTRKTHDEFHKIYKYGQNTPEQWEEFLEMKRLEKAS